MRNDIMVASFSKLLQEHITASVFWQPEKNFSSELTMHLPFIFWLMELTQPSSVVQVGAIHPVTYYGYCYAATKLQLETRCSLINLTDHDLNQPAAQLVDIQETFPAITQIIQGHLIETVHHFPNHSIDILHISGATSSQQVEDTITLYKDKLSQKAMILIDHISFLDYAAGKQSLWDKLKTLYPTYAFWHGRGLGIILFGQEPPQNIRHFFAAAEDPIIYAQLRSFFAQQGQNLLGYYAPEEHLKKISEEKEYWKNQAAQLNASLSWRVTQPLRSLSKKIPIIQFIKKILLSSKKKSLSITSSPALYPDMFDLNGFTTQCKIGVLIHIDALTAWDQTRKCLNNIPERYDLFVSLISNKTERLSATILTEFPHAIVKVFPEDTPESFPFIAYINSGVLNQYDAVLKIHLDHAFNLSEFNAILGTPSLASTLIQAMRQHSNIGIIGQAKTITAKDHDATTALHWTKKIYCESIPEPCISIKGLCFWIDPFILRLVQSLKISHKELIHHPITTDDFAYIISLLCQSAGMQMDSASTIQSKDAYRIPTTNNIIKTIAFYLPQFYPTQENDLWWGKGFTEWTSITKAKPYFDSHDQPKLPGDLGFYDLRLPENRQAQADLAKAYGIHGFCYYYYWFDSGKQILEYPLAEVMRLNKPDLPFCVCWANHNWSRRWDGRDQEILLEQRYSFASMKQLIHQLIILFRDPRYIRYQDKPIFVLYRLLQIPDYQIIMEMWRDECLRAGIGDIHIIAIDWGHCSQFGFKNLPPKAHGVDAYLTNPPLTTKAYLGLSPVINNKLNNLINAYQGSIFDYESEIDFDLEVNAKGYDILRHRGIMVGFDNTARHSENSSSVIFHGSNPAKFRRWLSGIITQELQWRPDTENLIFIQAWNEWAEGNMLEPTQRFGRGYLEAVKSCF